MQRHQAPVSVNGISARLAHFAQTCEVESCVFLSSVCIGLRSLHCGESLGIVVG